jgi:hypothetical protein
MTNAPRTGPRTARVDRQLANGMSESDVRVARASAMCASETVLASVNLPTQQPPPNGSKASVALAVEIVSEDGGSVVRSVLLRWPGVCQL